MPDFSLIHQVVEPRSGPAPHPGLMLLHGLGSNELDLLALAPALDPRLLAISVRAPLETVWGGYMWYDIDREGHELSAPGIGSALELLRHFVDEALEAYPIDAKKLYVGGFSMGAAMAGAMALLHPEIFSGAIITSGWLPPDSDGRYQVQQAAGHPFFQAHGTADGVVPVTYGRMTRDFLQTTRVELTYREYPIAHEVSEEELRELSGWLTRVLNAP